MRPVAFHRLAVRLLIAAAMVWSASSPAAQKDAPAIALLRAGKVDELQRQFSGVQAAYRQGSIDDRRLAREFRVFYATDPALEPKFALWIQKHPDSYVAYLARASYYTHIGLEKRGSEYISKTSEAQLRDMQLQFQKATHDLRKSMELDDKPLLSYLHAMDIAMHYSDDDGTRQLLDAATKIDPKNVIVRRMYLASVEPRWGGSLEKMREFVAECRKQDLPAAVLRDFQGIVEYQTAWTQHRKKQLPAAEASYRAALGLLAEPEDAWEGLGRVLVDQRKYQQAVDSLSTALGKYPDNREMWSRRAWSYKQLSRTELAVADYRRAAELGDPYSQNELGKYYWHGIAMAKDPQQAIAWFKKSAAQGNQEAKSNLDWAIRQTSGG